MDNYDDILNQSIDDLDWEPLGEMATIATSRDPQLRIQVNPDPGRVGDPYFKAYDHARIQDKGTRVARLSFFSSKIIHHKDHFKDWNITNKDIKHIHSILNESNIDHDEYTNWQMTKFKWNQEYGFIDLDDLDDYMNGKFDEEFSKHPSYVPSDTPIPETWSD